MAYREPVASVEVCNNAYEWNERSQDLDAAKGMKDEIEGYIELDYDEICAPSIYQRIFSRKRSKKVSHCDK